VKEQEIDSGRKRVDISYTNAARDGFFYRLHTAQQVASNFIMVECKNYSSDVGNPELDQLTGRFSTNRGKLGILVSRSFDERALFIARCRDTAQAGRGFILPLVDEDIYVMLEDIKQRRRSAIDSRLQSLFNELVL
jgi:Restriction endonuclease